MGNNMQFLLDYYRYIENIDNDIVKEEYIYSEIKKRTKFGKLTLVEGLIHTYPTSKSVEIIMRRFPELKINIESEGDIFIQGLEGNLNKYIPIITNLGYFISKYTINGDDWEMEYDEKIKPIAFYLEPKYDLEIDNIPLVLYHASPLKFKDKILKYGLSPRSGNKVSKHPERIYLTDDIEKSYFFGNYLKGEENKWYESGFCIYSIDGRSIKKLYSDINFRQGGYYTTNNINPNHIKLVKEIKI